ncbi:hypothetical protein ABZ532_30750 [Streptomyces sp. NPDC019396]|uniref:hypothetical protein n=1 Tax=Streptomyces sp. NPDC019396 TaxID=3154687 RepID=UPI0033F3548B
MGKRRSRPVLARGRSGVLAALQHLDRTGTALNGGLDAAGVRSTFLRLALRAYEDVTATAARTQRGVKAVEGARVALFGGPRPKPAPSTSEK